MEENTNKNPLFSTDTRDLIFTVLFFVGTFLEIAWGLGGSFKSGFALTHFMALTLGTVYFAGSKNKPTVYSVICGLISLLLSLPFAITSNETVRAFSLAAAVVLEWVWFASLTGKKIPKGDTGLISLLLKGFFNGFRDMPKSFKSLYSSEKSGNKNGVKIIAGIACSLPVVFIVLPLLIKSDAAFEGLVSSIVPDFATLLIQVILSFIAAPFIVGYAISLKYSQTDDSKIKESKGFDTVFLNAFFVLISLCYVVYLFSQTAYFFSAFSGILPTGYKFSYAEYARRGFFELCIIAGINFALIFFMILFSKKKDGKLPVSLRIIGTFIGIFTLLLCTTALSKMYLYVENYGMSVKRIGTSVFMAVLVIVFIAAIIRLFNSKVKVLQLTLVLSGIALVFLGTFNINSVVAKYNYQAYKSGKLAEIDTKYLSQLGDESVPYLYELLGDKEYGDDAKCALYFVSNNLYYYEDDGNYRKIYTKLYEMTPSLNKAYKIFEENKNLLDYSQIEKILEEYPDDIIIDYDYMNE